VLAAANATPVPRPGYRVGVPAGGAWVELANGDAEIYGGSGVGNLGGVDAVPVAAHGREWSLSLSLPPLGIVLLAPSSP
jgi:1,4-alpha-glucan branching enzyme